MWVPNTVLYLDDVEEFVSVNAAVAIHIIQFEVPAQLVLHLPAHHQAEGGHILHEVYVAILRQSKQRTLVKTAKHHQIRIHDCRISAKVISGTSERNPMSTYLNFRLCGVKRARMWDSFQGRPQHRQLSLHVSIVSRIISPFKD